MANEFDRHQIWIWRESWARSGRTRRRRNVGAPHCGAAPDFFVMLLAAGLGTLLYRWSHGPAIRCLLFAGIPVVLTANFVIGGSRIGEAFELRGMNSVLAYGFFGQAFWMFGGIALLMFLGRSAAVGIVSPGMAGSLSHAGLTGACTAGDLGETAAKAPQS